MRQQLGVTTGLTNPPPVQHLDP
ncbi:MAG: hypothetical protein HW381_1822, partial [Candidatus Rokubacteria bacterium]|nr:hypothetical protein [Candidatus Rokubacteria bacterium]